MFFHRIQCIYGMGQTHAEVKHTLTHRENTTRAIYKENDQSTTTTYLEPSDI